MEGQILRLQGQTSPIEPHRGGWTQWLMIVSTAWKEKGQSGGSGIEDC